MGIISFSIPKDLVLAIKERIRFDNFIETGTFKGNTSFWAAGFFNKVYTIEISPEISKETAARPDKPHNIEFIVGDSRVEMPKLLERVTGRSFFWLDGHWCMGADGKDNECPLMNELKAIVSCDNPVIFIDDARCFLGPLPPPHNYKDWPAIDEIFAFCKENFPNSFTTIIDDVIVCVPEGVRPVIYDYWMKTFNERYYGGQNNNIVPQKSLVERVLLKGRSIIKNRLLKKETQPVLTPEDIERNAYIGKNRWLNGKGLKTILDIGANEGQFVHRLRWVLPDIKIISFEPIPSMFDKLKDNFKDDANFEAYNVGLGDENAEVEFHLNEYSPSSSLLKMNTLHKENFPHTQKEESIKATIKRLDDVINISQLVKPYMVKIDVQGYEEKVIRGGMDVIKNADLLIIETSFIQLYEGEPLFDGIYSLLKELGFEYKGSFDQLFSPLTGEILQGDAIFVKK